MGLMKQKISILYPYFVPGYKAGGITQSLYNLATFLKNDFDVQVICYNHDMNDPDVYSIITDNIITNVEMDGFNVVYISKQEFSKQAKIAVEKFSPHYIYISSIYDFKFLFLGLSLLKKDRKLIIAPRGMLQNGAMQQKRVKKIIFLNLLKCLFVFKESIRWHATDSQEKLDIQKWFGNKALVEVAIDTPRKINQNLQLSTKLSNEIKLVYYSLITEKKNLILILESLSTINVPIKFDIFGPTPDQNYWTKCQAIINSLPTNIEVNYKSELPFESFSKIANQYNFFILPTRGENFGHVIYESLSLGLPVIISEFTPWKFKQGSIGFYVNLDTISLKDTILKLYKMDVKEYQIMRDAALEYSKKYYNDTVNLLEVEYEKIFSI